MTFSFPANPYETEVDAAAAQYNVPAALLDAQEYAESTYQPGAVSPTGAFGISQFEPATAAEYGVQPGTTPAAIQTQISGQAHLMSNLLQQYGGSITDALSAYNAGGNQANWNNGQTNAYVSKIEGMLGGATTASQLGNSVPTGAVLTSANTGGSTGGSGGSSNPLSSALSDIAAPVTSIFTRLSVIAVGILLILVAVFGLMESDSQTSVVTEGVKNMRNRGGQ